jgi:hypothetical protein
MPSRLCPICRKVPLTRREVKTCGSINCVRMWRSYSPDEKVRAMEGTLDDTDEFFGVSSAGQMARPTPEIPTKTTQRDNEFLTKVFGPDAPGVVKEEDQPVIYGHEPGCDCKLCVSTRKAIK